MANAYTQTPASIRLVIADDHALFRSGLCSLLKQDKGLQVVGEAGNGRELVQEVQEKAPDIVLTDIHMPVMCGVEATGIIRKLFPRTNVIALSMHDGEDDMLRMMAAGARGYLFKNTDGNEIVQAVHAVHAHGVYYCATASTKPAKVRFGNCIDPYDPCAEPKFSERDIKIIRLLCREQSSKEIAAVLNLNCRAVEGARERIQEKMSARNMVGIVVYAIRHGIFSVG